MPDFSFKLDNRITYKVNGDEMLIQKSMIEYSGEYKCEILFKSSGDFYIMGDTFLRNYYSVYDLEGYRMALGKVFEFDAPLLIPDIVDPSPTTSEEIPESDNVLNLIIFACIFVPFMLFAVCVCKRRCAA